MQSLRFTAGAFALCAIAAACSDTPVAPTARVAPNAAARSATTGGSQLISNSHKYRQQTYVHASNRSGVASLTGRALLAKNGVTTLEVTTGALDAATAPGNISKMQIKLLDPNGVAQETYNLNGLSGGRQTTTINGRPAHSKIQVQGNVRDIDPKRTDVVTITERVNRLPDVAVTDLTMPSESKPNASFLVSSTITELNGDLGATMSCVMYVDGTETDRANGVWVAEGDAVNCAFQARIATEGQHTITVKAESVSPTDWDVANNAMTKSIVIRSPEVPLHGWANVWSYHREYGNRQSSSWQSLTDLSSYSWADSSGSEYQEEQAYFWSNSANAAISFPLDAAHLTIKSGATTYTDINTTTPQNWWGDSNNGCQYFYQNNDWLQVCRDPWNGASVYGGHQGGKSVYYSRGFSSSTDWDGTYYHNEYDNTYSYWQYGTLNSGFGDDAISFDVRVESGATVLTASPVVQFQYTDSFDWGSPRQCWDYSDSWYTQHYCYEYIDRYVQKSGNTNF